MLQDAEIAHERVTDRLYVDFPAGVCFPQIPESMLHLERALFPESDMVAPYAVSAKIDALRLCPYRRLVVQLQVQVLQQELTHAVAAFAQVSLIRAYDDHVVHITQVMLRLADVLRILVSCIEIEIR